MCLTKGGGVDGSRTLYCFRLPDRGESSGEVCCGGLGKRRMRSIGIQIHLLHSGSGVRIKAFYEQGLLVWF